MKLSGRINRTTFHFEIDRLGWFVKWNGQVKSFVRFASIRVESPMESFERTMIL